MTYYTDQDRERAAARRKASQQFRQLMKSPEDVYDILGYTPPKISVVPKMLDYGVADSTKSELASLDEASKRRQYKWRYSIIVAVLFVIFVFIQHSQGIGGGIAVCGVIGFWPLLMALSDPTPAKTSLHEQYGRYTSDVAAYEYWQRKKNKDHWNSMSGHSFEQAVANLFRNIGFTADVSNRGGDGGVDIVLRKADRRIAVQCKRYRSPVGPHVIRDLWGTINYLGFEEGCIVTTTGFTRGVIDFAKDKSIFLIDLNDILKATGEAGAAHLKRQIGDL